MFDFMLKNPPFSPPDNCNSLQRSKLQIENCNPLQHSCENQASEPRTIRSEASDNYPGEIIRVGRYRVIVCKNGEQWIVQKQASSAGAQTGRTWKAIGYHLTRKPLTRVWQEKSAMPPPEQLLDLPEKFPYRK